MKNESSIFKFHQVSDYTLDALKNSYIYCNHFTAFNDPFECWCTEVSGIPDPILEKDRFTEIYRAWGFEDPDFSDEGITMLNDYCSEFVHDHSMKVEQYIESAKIACFSRVHNSLLMWSHYTNGMRGFCIEFNPDVLIGGSNDATILKVQYKKKPAVLDTMLFEVANDQIWFHEMAIEEETGKKSHIKNYKPKYIKEYAWALKKARKLIFDLYAKQLAVKPLEWKYENEIRLVFHSNENTRTGQFFEYPAVAVKSIVIGEKMSENDKVSLMSVIKENYPYIKVGAAKRERNTFNIIISYES